MIVQPVEFAMPATTVRAFVVLLTCAVAVATIDPPVGQLGGAGSGTCKATGMCTGGSYDYCIVGAGPGGLQLGHLMNEAKRNYIIFEKAPSAGSFFEAFPVHRKLISLNKRFTGRDDREFNLRHDWNSLLNNDDVTPMTKRTKERWPQADVLVQYLRDYAGQQEAAGRIRYNTTVLSIDRVGTDGTAQTQHQTQHHAPFTLGVVANNENSDTKSSVECGSVVMATGLDESHAPPSVQGIEHTIGYEDLPQTGEAFEDQAVAVLGFGNAAFETADALAPYVKYVHLIPGRKRGPEKGKNMIVSWESRYVGHVRAINAALLDSYLLKSLDGFTTGTVADKSIIVKCGHGLTKRCLFDGLRSIPSVTRNGPPRWTVSIGRMSRKDPVSAALFKTLDDAGHVQLVQSGGAGEGRVGVGLSGAEDENGKTMVVEGEVHTDFQWVTLSVDALKNESLVNQVAELARRGGSPHPLMYDHIVRCLGWKHGTGVYTTRTKPIMQPNGKYAIMNHEYESVNVPGLYYAGTLAHGKDHQRSAGGFIHGFRYTARVLFRMLEAKYHNQAWPGRVFDNVQEWDGEGVGLGDNGCNKGDFNAPPAGCIRPPVHASSFESMIDKIFARINTASGPYQMVGVLGDGALLKCPGAGSEAQPISATYLQETTAEYFNAHYDHLPRFFWQFGYAQQAQSLDASRKGGTLFQVHVWWYPGDCSGQAPPPHKDGVRIKEVLRVYEDFHTNWNTWEVRTQVAKWLNAKISSLQPGVAEPHMHEEWTKPCSVDMGQQSMITCMGKPENTESMQCLAEMNEDQSSICSCLTASAGLAPCVGRACMRALVDQLGCSSITSKPRPATLRWPRDGDQDEDSGARLAVSMAGARVDINIRNLLGDTVDVFARKSLSTTGEFEFQGRIDPSSGARFVAHERETWVAKDLRGTVQKEWVVDIAKGILQDVLLAPSTTTTMA